MQQRFRRFALFFGATALAAGGFIMVACGTDNGTTPTPSAPETGTSKEGGGGTPEGGPTSEGGPGTDGGVDADCSKNPVLHDYKNGFRCAFLPANDAGPDGGSNSNCANTETCCNTSDKSGANFQPSYCATGKGTPGNDAVQVCKTQAATHQSSFDAGNAWECADKNNCTTGVCCMIQDQARLAMDPAKNKLNIGNTPATDKNHPPACGVKRAYNEGGSRCKTACDPAANDIRLCSLSDDGACGAGTTCKPFVDFQGTHRGACLP